MRTRTKSIFLILPLLLLALSPAASHAILPGGDVYFGYDHVSANNFYPNTPGLNGWDAAAHLKLMPFFGIEANVAQGGYGKSALVRRTTTVLFGPRVTLGAAGIHVFAHGLVGGEHSSDNAANPTPTGGSALAVDFGGGVDFKIAPFFAWRVGLDYLEAPTQSGGGNHDSFTTGLVFRF